MFSDINKADLLDVLRRARGGLCRSDLNLPLHGPVHEWRDRILEAVDGLAAELTGQRDTLLEPGFEALGSSRPAARGATGIRRALIIDALATELVLSPDTPETRETLLGPIADSVLAALEGRRPTGEPSVADLPDGTYRP